jgi:hypothetical protein
VKEQGGAGLGMAGQVLAWQGKSRQVFKTMKGGKVMESSKKMEDVFEMALEELRAVYKNNKPVTDKTKFALSAMGIYSRLKSQENNAKSLQYRIIKDFSKDKEELRDYITQTQPDFKPIKTVETVERKKIE